MKILVFESKKILFAFFLICFLVVGMGTPLTWAANQNSLDDALLAKKYERYLKYEKYQLYKEYKKVKQYKDEERYAKLYESYLKDPQKYRGYSVYKSNYDFFRQYREKKQYALFGKYKFFNNEENKKYNTVYYKAAYDRIQVALAAQDKGSLSPLSLNESPEIRIGLNSYKKKDLLDRFITIKVNCDSQVLEENGDLLAKIPGNTEIRVFFDFSKREYRVVSLNLDKTTKKAVVVVPDNEEQGVLEVANTGSYRGKIEIRFASFTKNLWIINQVPIEYYVWGMKEAANAAPVEYLKAITVAYRSYGLWKAKNGSSYKKEGFDLRDTELDQLYGGYGQEDNQPNVVLAAKNTAGKVVEYGGKLAITPHCSGTDGNTRSWKETWGSEDYPWCQSVPDPFGIRNELSDGDRDYMVGMSEAGAYNYAKEQGWSYEKILKYYYKGITVAKEW